MIQFNDANKVMDEILAGCAKRDMYLRFENEIICRAHGPAYLAAGGAYTDHENHTFEWIALHSAKLIASNPTAAIEAFGNEDARKEAELLEDAVNQDIRKSDLRRLIQDAFPDWAMYWNVTATFSEPEPGEEFQDNPIHGAHTYLLERRDVFWDVYAKRWADVRIVGNRVVCDKEDLVQRAKDHPEEGWDLQAIRALKPKSNLHTYDGEPSGDLQQPSVDRGEVEYWNVFLVQDSKKVLRQAGLKKSELHAKDNGDKLFNGMLLTVATEDVKAENMRSRFLRPARPHFGAPSDESIRGPYVLHGCYTIPKHVFPLSPVIAVWHQNRELNNHVDRMLTHSRSARHFTGIDGLSTDDADQLKNAKDGEVKIIPGLDKNRTFDFNFDGLTQEDLGAYQILKVRRDEASGMPQTARGVAANNGTATEVDRAADASDARAEFCAQRLADGWNAVVKQRAWLLRNDYRTCLRLKSGLYLGGWDVEKAIRYALGRGLIKPEEADVLLQPEVMQQFETSRLPWSQLDLKIDVYSMQRTTAALQQQRLTEGTDGLVVAAPIMPQTPFIDWAGWAEKRGQALNWPGYGDLVHTDELQAFAQAQAQAAAQAAQGEQAPQAAIRSPVPSQGVQQPQAGTPGGKPKTGSTGNSSGARLAGAARKAG